MASKPKSKCIFCGSSQYGSNCAYSPLPSRIHIHQPVNADECIYCGSNKLGSGCPYSPGTGKRHCRGMPYQMYMKEGIEVSPEEALLQESLVTAYFIKRLFEKFEDTEAFRLGLIDKDGRRLKRPITIEEKASITSFDVFINQIKRTLGSQLDIIKNSFGLMISTPEPINESVELFEKKCKLGYKFKAAIKEFNELILESKKQGLSNDDVEELILKSFFE